MIETVQISNVKPNTWYNELYQEQLKIENSTLEDIDWFDEEYNPKYQIERDKKIWIYEQIGNNYQKYRDFFLENDLEEYERKRLILDDISYDQFLEYYDCINYTDYPHFISQFNTIEKNKEVLDKIIELLPKLKIEKKFHVFYISIVNLVNKCKAIFPSHLITGHLFFLLQIIPEWFITKDGKEIWYDDNEHFNILFEEPRILPKKRLPSDKIDFSDFSLTDDIIINTIRKNKKWHNLDRDLSLYHERQQGKYLDELARNFNMKRTTISMAIKKVQGAINFYKGKLFEEFAEKRLKEYSFFSKVIKEAGSGEADLLAYTKDEKELYIYSLKNIKIDHKSYWLDVNELRPELKKAKLCSLDYKVHLILLVFDNYQNQVKAFQIDYNNAGNIDISK